MPQAKRPDTVRRHAVSRDLSIDYCFCEFGLRALIAGAFVQPIRRAAARRHPRRLAMAERRRAPGDAARKNPRGRNLDVPPDVAIRCYETMLRIRRFEERVAVEYAAGNVKGTAHSYIGEEAIAAGVCANLRPDDYIASYHRGHGHAIAKGASLDGMMAELMGRSNGLCGGLGGSMHVADIGLGILGANGIVGAGMPLALGAALAAKIRGSDQVAVAFFGDGGANQGVFHEALNIAAVWRLPMLFVCENNLYALNTPMHQTTSVDRIALRAAAYGIPGLTIDGNDAIEVYRIAQEAVERARAGDGPTLIEALTWRWGEHSLRVNLPDPRDAAEKSRWRARDPIEILAPALPARRAQEIESSVASAIDGAVAHGLAGAEPDEAGMLAAVYAPHADHVEPTHRGGRKLDFVGALNEALHQEMARDDSVFVMGEDVAETGGIFRVTRGLVERFGRDRVRDTPISEATFCGAGVGAAVAGMRPVVEVQIFDFITLMMDMLVNQAAKFRYMMGGKPTVPLVVRGPQGGGIRLAAQHSQSLEAWFTHVPGLVVVAPSSPYDAKGLLTAAIRDDNPVIFLEQKLLYLTRGEEAVPEEPYAIPLGKAALRRTGTDVTVLATMAMVPRAEQAAVQLERDGISVEVIDPRTLWPLDEAAILDSVRKTNRLMIVHEGWKRGGWGAEISALVTEKAFDWLDAPVARLGAPDVPMPFNDALERSVIPSAEKIAAAVRAMF
jgi:2-oxoisovalerate dehydrogenase E1 component